MDFLNISVKEMFEGITSSSTQHQYMMLDRLKTDCNYFLGFGNRSVKNLWALNVAEHIDLMKALWNNFTDKPEWLTFEEIEEFENKMK